MDDSASKVREIEAKYISVLEERIAALEIANAKLKLDTASAASAVPDTRAQTAAPELIENGLKSPVYTNSPIENSVKQTENNKLNENSNDSSKNSCTNDEKANDWSSRVRYRESRYNDRGIKEESDATANWVKDEEKKESKEQAMTVLRSFSEEGKYIDSEVRIQDSKLLALVQFAMAHHPDFKHFSNNTTVIWCYSPFDCYIQSWSDCQALADLNEDNPRVKQLREQIEIIRDSRNKNSPIPPQILEVLENLVDEDSLKGAARDFQALLYNIKMLPDVAPYFEREQQLQNNQMTKYKYLWALFSPGTIVISTTNTFMKEPQLFIVNECVSTYDGDTAKSYIIWCWTYDWNGSNYSRGLVKFVIDYFSGEKTINSLPCYPLEYHREKKTVWDELVKRGKEFNRLCLKSDRPPFYDYDGIAIVRGEGLRKIGTQANKQPSNSDEVGSMTTMEQSGRRQPLKDRVMVDFKAYIDHGPTGSSNLPPMGDLFRIETPAEDACKCDDCKNNWQLRDNQKILYDDVKDLDEFSDPQTKDLQYAICPPRVLGYHLNKKRWVELDVNKIKPIGKRQKKDTSGFDMLEMDVRLKSLIKDLVQNHSSGTLKTPLMMDLTHGKGNGLVILLHGPPGVGKTLTAESLAHATGKPLFSVSVSDISTTPVDVEKSLQALFDLAAAWQAIMLFDEADVFLESRGNNTANMERNAMVSVLLRALEYYNGILILTTNRIKTLDVAVQSRINLAIRYDNLSPQQKKKIYQNFINQLTSENADKNELLSFINSCEDDESPFKTLNGRQIRNILFSAASIAVGSEADGRMKLSHVKRVLKETLNFQDDVNSIMEKARSEAEVKYNANRF